MPLSATMPVRTFAAGKRCFIRQKHAFIDRILRPACQRLESAEVVKAPTGVVALITRLLRLGDHIESKKRSGTGQLLIGITEHGRLKIAFGLSGGPAARGSFPVHDADIPPVLHEKVPFADQRLFESGNVDFERLRDAFDPTQRGA